ncbi:hypothetical protein Pmani_026047 [Petrolisthes manimaculis]|uniref:Rhodanese domain-containing protein n=1 Tax=Petrolisthes manimaculis TaxID=1843537 RepID=A0AAE1P6W9_9EUCA|nr:hypothetical protein Pmani_026047 [Petrolisthes manimaculis]
MAGLSAFILLPILLSFSYPSILAKAQQEGWIRKDYTTTTPTINNNTPTTNNNNNNTPTTTTNNNNTPTTTTTNNNTPTTTTNNNNTPTTTTTTNNNNTPTIPTTTTAEETPTTTTTPAAENTTTTTTAEETPTTTTTPAAENTTTTTTSSCRKPGITYPIGIEYGELSESVGRGAVKLIDIRQPWELIQTGKLPGSYNIPMNQLVHALSLSEHQFLHQYNFPKPRPRDSNVVLTCRSGRRVRVAWNQLEPLGYCNVRLYFGSYLDWKANGGPLLEPDSSQTLQ